MKIRDLCQWQKDVCKQMNRTGPLFSIYICLHCCFCLDSHGDSGWDVAGKVVSSDQYVNQVNKWQVKHSR